ARSPVTLGVVTGLVIGKLVGVSGAILLATRLGLGRLPSAVTTRHVFGLAGLAGIGFTVSLFITALAFDEPAVTDQAKLGVLTAPWARGPIPRSVPARSLTGAARGADAGEVAAG